jgi:hypothetical protein
MAKAPVDSQAGDNYSKLPFWTDEKSFNPKMMCEKAKKLHNYNVSYPGSIRYTIQVGMKEGAVVQINGVNASVKEIADLVANKKLLYVVYGCFYYSTAGKKEYTNWCVLLDPIKVNSEFSYCPYGNYPSEGKK